MNVTPYSLTQRYVGQVVELPGEEHAPFIQWCFTLCGFGPDTADEVPWCSAFLQFPFWLLRLPRSKSARARSWLTVGVPIDVEEARPDSDVIVLARGEGAQPGPEVIDAPGHVGLFAGLRANGDVLVLAGNQGNNVSIQTFAAERVLGVRRIA